MKSSICVVALEKLVVRTILFHFLTTSTMQDEPLASLRRAGLPLNVYWLQGTPKPLAIRVVMLQEVPSHSGVLSWLLAEASQQLSKMMVKSQKMEN